MQQSPTNYRSNYFQLFVKLIDVLMKPPYVQFISDHIIGSRQSALTRGVFKMFETVLTCSIPAGCITRYLRLHDPLSCSGMAVKNPPLRPEVYKSILFILSNHRRRFYEGREFCKKIVPVNYFFKQRAPCHDMEL